MPQPKARLTARLRRLYGKLRLTINDELDAALKAARRAIEYFTQAVSADQRTHEDNSAGMAAWGLVHGLSSLFIDGLVPETSARGMANAILVQRPRPEHQATDTMCTLSA